MVYVDSISKTSGVLLRKRVTAGGKSDLNVALQINCIVAFSVKHNCNTCEKIHHRNQTLNALQR